jgi:PBSX family phage terminase large subunit
MDDAKRIEFIHDKYYTDPIGFCHDVLNIPELDHWQIDFLNSIVDTKRIAVAGGTGSGKSYILGAVALWYYCTRPKSKVILTSTNASTLETRTFFDCKQLLLKSQISDLFDFLHRKIRFKGEKGKIESYIEAITGDPQNPEGLRGFHAEYGFVLILVDEASYLPKNLYDSLLGNLTSGKEKIIMISNPTKTDGPFFDCFNSPNWTIYNVNSENSKFVSPEYCKEMEEEYGRESAVYQAKILGQFPKVSFESFIPQIWLDTCFKTKIIEKAYKDFPKVLGIDVALSGDDYSVICVRQGRKIHKFIKLQIDDTNDLVQEIVKVFNLEKADLIAIDANGMGQPVRDILRNFIPKEKIISIISQSTKNVNQLRYSMKRQEIMFNMKDFIREECEIPYNEDLNKEIKAIETFVDNKNRLCVESKKRMKARGLPSPDHTDALAMALSVKTDNLWKVETIRKIEKADHFTSKNGGGSWMAR